MAIADNWEGWAEGTLVRWRVSSLSDQCVTIYVNKIQSTQPRIQWLPGLLTSGVKRPGREADHSPPSSAEIKIEWSYISTPLYVFMAWCLIEKCLLLKRIVFS